MLIEYDWMVNVVKLHAFYLFISCYLGAFLQIFIKTKG